MGYQLLFPRERIETFAPRGLVIINVLQLLADNIVRSPTCIIMIAYLSADDSEPQPYLLGFQLAGALMTPLVYLAIMMSIMHRLNSSDIRMQSIVICRFMLNLKRAGGESVSESTTVHRSTIRFNTNTLIGNLGDSLNLWDEEVALELIEQGEPSKSLLRSISCVRSQPFKT